MLVGVSVIEVVVVVSLIVVSVVVSEVVVVVSVVDVIVVADGIDMVVVVVVVTGLGLVEGGFPDTKGTRKHFPPSHLQVPPSHFGNSSLSTRGVNASFPNKNLCLVIGSSQGEAMAHNALKIQGAFKIIKQYKVSGYLS